MVEPVFGGKRVQSVTFLGRAANSVIAAHARIQVTDSVRHTVGKRYPGMGMDPPVFTGVTIRTGFPLWWELEKRGTVDTGSTIFVVGARKFHGL